MRIGVVFPQTELGGDVGAVRAYGERVDELGFTHLLAYDHVVGADPAVHTGWKRSVQRRHDVPRAVRDVRLPRRGHRRSSSSPGSSSCRSARPRSSRSRRPRSTCSTEGRFRLGVGLGWNAVEYEALGKDFSNRGKRLDEQIELLRRLWTEPSVTFDGELRAGHGRRARAAAGAATDPGLDRRGRRAAALRRVGRLADGWFPQVPPGDEARRARVAIVSRGRDRRGPRPGRDRRRGPHQLGRRRGRRAGRARGRWRDAGRPPLDQHDERRPRDRRRAPRVAHRASAGLGRSRLTCPASMRVVQQSGSAQDGRVPTDHAKERTMSDVIDNEAEHRFEVTIDGHRGELTYELEGDRITLIHTGVPEELEGHGLAGQLVQAAVDRATPRAAHDHPDLPVRAPRLLQEACERAGRRQDRLGAGAALVASAERYQVEVERLAHRGFERRVVERLARRRGSSRRRRRPGRAAASPGPRSRRRSRWRRAPGPGRPLGAGDLAVGALPLLEQRRVDVAGPSWCAPRFIPGAMYPGWMITTRIPKWPSS